LKQPSENQKESAGPQKKQVAYKSSDQSMQEEIVNSNATHGMFVAASEEEKVSIITKCVFSLLTRNGGYSL
jgi:hypothetical protein